MKSTLLLLMVAVCLFLGGCNIYYADQAVKKGEVAFEAGRRAENNRDTRTADEQYRQAKVQFQAAVSQDPKGWTRHYKLARACQELKEYDRAIREYDTALQLRPDKVVTHARKVDCLIEMGAPQDDIDNAVRKGVAIVGHHSHIYLTQATAYYRMSRLEDMPPVLENAVRASPRDSYVRATVGRHYLAIGDRESAIKHLEIAYQLDPKEENVAFDLGRLGRRLPLLPES